VYIYLCIYIYIYILALGRHFLCALVLAVVAAISLRPICSMQTASRDACVCICCLFLYFILVSFVFVLHLLT